MSLIDLEYVMQNEEENKDRCDFLIEVLNNGGELYFD